MFQLHQRRGASDSRRVIEQPAIPFSLGRLDRSERCCDRRTLASIATFGVTMSFSGIAEAAGVTVQLGSGDYHAPVVVEHESKRHSPAYHHAII